MALFKGIWLWLKIIPQGAIIPAMEKGIQTGLLVTSALLGAPFLGASRGTLLLATGAPIAVTWLERPVSEKVAAVVLGILLTSGRVPWRAGAAFGLLELGILTVVRLHSADPPPASPRSWANGERAVVAAGTLEAIEQGGYLNGAGDHVELSGGEELRDRTEKLPLRGVQAPRSQTQRVEVVEGDCLEVAGQCVASGDRTALVVFASPTEPGGGFIEGTSGQEEHCAYRSEIAGFMQTQLGDGSFYHIGAGVGESWSADSTYLLHTPDVRVFRASQAQEFAFLDEPFRVGMICCPALVYPKLHEGDYAHGRDRNAAEELIRAQLRVASEKGYDAVVLGAFGCGAFKNPPQVVAQLFRQVIDSEFPGAFKRIVFAILDDPHRGPHNPRGNLIPFRKAFP